MLWQYNDIYHSDDELYHFGVKGMKWGVRKKRYTSTSLRAYAAKRQNDKVDKSFKNWQVNTQRKTNAIDAGKKANIARITYETSGDRGAKKAYKQANREYKKALRSNTSYRKGAIRGEVGSDMSRKYLSEAKKVQKQMKDDPNNKQLQKQYSQLMSQHDIERAKARKAPAVGAKRSARKAAMKRRATMTVKATVTTAAVGAGLKMAQKYGGLNINMSSEDFIRRAKTAKDFMGFFY